MILLHTNLNSDGLKQESSMNTHRIYTIANGFIHSHGVSLIPETNRLHAAPSESSYDHTRTIPNPKIPNVLTNQKYCLISAFIPSPRKSKMPHPFIRTDTAKYDCIWNDVSSLGHWYYIINMKIAAKAPPAAERIGTRKVLTRFFLILNADGASIS